MYLTYLYLYNVKTTLKRKQISNFPLNYRTNSETMHGLAVVYHSIYSFRILLFRYASIIALKFIVFHIFSLPFFAYIIFSPKLSEMIMLIAQKKKKDWLVLIFLFRSIFIVRIYLSSATRNCFSN